MAHPRPSQSRVPPPPPAGVRVTVRVRVMVRFGADPFYMTFFRIINLGSDMVAVVNSCWQSSIIFSSVILITVKIVTWWMGFFLT